MKTLTKVALGLPVSLMAMAVAATPSFAANLTGVASVVDQTVGTGIESWAWNQGENDFNRADIDNLFNDSLNDFYSLGKNGEAVFSFGSGFTGEVNLWEATNAVVHSTWKESVKVYVGTSLNDFQLLGTIDARQGTEVDPKGVYSHSLFTNTLFGDQVFNYIKLVDTSIREGGLDIVALSANTVSVPEPATTVGLFGVAAVGMALRNRKGLKKG